MPSPLLQLRIPQDLADWLEAKYPSRGEVAEYVRQLLTAEQMKEAAAPLVPESLAVPGHWGKGLLTDEEWASFQEGAGFETPEETEILDRMHGITSEATVGEIADALEAEKAKPKARRKVKPPKEYDFAKDRPEGCVCTYDMLGRIWNSACKVHDSASDKRTQNYVASVFPARCNRGACTGTIKPNGRCIRCNQEPLKESK